MKIYKLEVIIIDFDEVGEEDIIDILETTRYPNRCISPNIIDVKSADIGEWDDDHELNRINLTKEQYNKYFL